MHHHLQGKALELTMVRIYAPTVFYENRELTVVLMLTVQPCRPRGKYIKYMGTPKQHGT